MDLPEACEDVTAGWKGRLNAGNMQSLYLPVEQERGRHPEREAKPSDTWSPVAGRVLGDGIWSKLWPRSFKTYSWGRARQGRFYSFSVKIRNLDPTLNLQTTNV